MALKVKVGMIGLFDMLKFANMAKDREKVIQAAPAKEINGEFIINQKAKQLHPDRQILRITEIIEHTSADAKTFVFANAAGGAVAYFRAGQYLSVSLKIGGSSITRPISICSSPKEALAGKVAITVKRNTDDGFASGWMLDNWKVGDEVTVSGAQGSFFYEDMRDAKNVIALAGGSGITPFLSMAKAIAEGTEDFNLTILFGSRTEEGILFKNELNEICDKCDKVKVVHILSNEEKAGFEHGFITSELISKYADAPYSVFICGPEAMYRFVAKEVDKLGLEKKFVRNEMLGVTKHIWENAKYPAEAKGKTFNLTIVQGDKTYSVPAAAEESILVAIERAGITAPSRCRSGECSWCRSRLVSGEVFVPEENEYRRWADIQMNLIHPCATFALSDLILEVPGSYQ